jgi:MoaA/NifB/PqqE/SkfB family radical SAM enzyme
LVTNGMLLSPKRLDAIQPHTDLLVISVDGKPASHNTMRNSPKAFATMASRLELLRRSGIRFGFIFTLTQHNLDELPWVAEFAVNAGARLLQIHPLEGFGNALRTLPGKVPDATEGAYAWALAERIRGATAGRLAVQVDLVHTAAVSANPAAFYAEYVASSGEDLLADLLTPLVIEPDGAVVPLQYGFAREYALGNLYSQTVPRMARRWRQFTRPAFGALCRSLSQELATAPPRFINWYEAVAAHAAGQRLPPEVTLPRLVSEATAVLAQRG